MSQVTNPVQSIQTQSPQVAPEISGPLGEIPLELVVKIFASAPSAKEVAALGSTCRALNEISKDEGVWRSFIERHFPHCGVGKVPRPCGGYLNFYKFLTNPKLTVKGGNTCRKIGEEGISFMKLMRNHLCTQAENSGTFSIKDVTIDPWIQTFEGHHKGLSRIKASGDFLYTYSSRDKTLKTWDRTTGKCCHTFTFGEEKNTSFQVAGNLFYTTSPCGTWIFGRGAKTGECCQTFGTGGDEIRNFRIQGNNLFASSANGTMTGWDIVTKKSLAAFTGYGGDRGLKADAKHLYAFEAGSSNIDVWDITTGDKYQSLTGHQRAIVHIKVDEDQLYSLSAEHEIKIWDSKTRQCFLTLKRKEGTPYLHENNKLDVSENLLLVVPLRGSIQLWNKTTGEGLEWVPWFNGNMTQAHCAKTIGSCLFSLTRENQLEILDFSTKHQSVNSTPSDVGDAPVIASPVPVIASPVPVIASPVPVGASRYDID